MQILAKSSPRRSTFFGFSFFPEHTSGKILPICRKSVEKELQMIQCFIFPDFSFFLYISVEHVLLPACSLYIPDSPLNINLFYRKIQCVFAFLSQNPMRFTL